MGEGTKGDVGGCEIRGRGHEAKEMVLEMQLDQRKRMQRVYKQPSVQEVIELTKLRLGR